jgi:two-component system NtrC family sensor kinase
VKKRTTSSSTSALARWAQWTGPGLPVVVVAVLLCLGVANILARAAVQEAEDGVLWAEGPEGVVAADIAEGTPAAAVGLVRGDVLLAINDRPVQSVSDVVGALHETEADATARYTVLRLGAREVVDLQIAPIPNGARPFYFLLASIGIFTLLVGGAVRLRRPRDPATLHFFWLSVAFFGLFTFSFSGRLDRLDWIFYWGDAVSILLLPALFLHFAVVFPQRTQRWAARGAGRVLVPLIYAPALALGAARVIALARSGGNAPRFLDIVATLDRLDYLYLVCCFVGGLFALTRALAEVRSVTARRQLRWIAWGTALGATPFILGYALPWAMGVDPSLPMQLSAIPLSLIPLAYASAIVRYRLLDVEVIVKRTLGYSAALAVVAAIYAGLLQGFERVFAIGDTGNSWVLAAVVTVIALLLVPPVKQAIQNALDRAFYRDRYDYRRALVGFARDLNSDLDLNRLAERLVSRVTETLLVDRMALMLADGASLHFGSVRASGFADRPPATLSKASSIGARLCAGHTVALDDPIAASRFEAEDVEFWRDEGLYHFIPCVSAERTIALLAVGRKNNGESLNSEDTALLAAVAGQIATALENARLYRQLHVKALELDRVRAFNENILESLDDGLMVTDLDDRIVRWNRALEQLYGVPRTEAVGQRLHDLFEDSIAEAISAARRDAPGGATLSRIQITARGDEAGRTAIVNAAVVPLRASDEQSTTTVGTIVILEDVTRRVELEEQLQISEKMASIGLLAAGVAHEVNTPLTGISSFTQMLLEGADPQDSRTRLLEKIERQTFRAAKIVNSLLNLSRAPSAAGKDLTSVDLNKVINEVLALIKHQFEVQSITVRRELWADPVIVVGEEHKLQQVFLNLLLNAKDAMPKGGWLTVLTSATGDRVTVELADTGSGIPSEYLGRIYDPFFTTKAIGQGTGLGLSITYGIVREHEGSIDCESTVGRGTRFVLGFPSVSAAAPARIAHS